MKSLGRVCVLLSLALPLGLAGCSGGDKTGTEKPFIVRGRLLDNGRPYVLEPSKTPLPPGGRALPPGINPSSALTIEFIATQVPKEHFLAETNADAGTFEVKGTDGKGITAGRYKIAVTGRFGFGPDTPDLFKGQFTPEKTQIIRDIKEGEEVVIDVSKPQG